MFLSLGFLTCNMEMIPGPWRHVPEAWVSQTGPPVRLGRQHGVPGVIQEPSRCKLVEHPHLYGDLPFMPLSSLVFARRSEERKFVKLCWGESSRLGKLEVPARFSGGFFAKTRSHDSGIYIL